MRELPLDGISMPPLLVQQRTRHARYRRQGAAKVCRRITLSPPRRDDVTEDLREAPAERWRFPSADDGEWRRSDDG
jgi:hypothetical protein